jgi:tetratricopeptide (TPR) repeat protein
MSDEWYVLSSSKVRGPATAAQLRKALADGKIQPETPVRSGAKGAWTFVREIPELGAVPETASQGVQDSVLPDGPDFTQVAAAPQTTPEGDEGSVVLGSTDLTQVFARRGRSNRLELGRTMIAVLLSAGLIAAVLAAIQLSRPSGAKPASPTAIDSDVAPPGSETREINELKTAPVSPETILPVAKAEETPTAAKAAELHSAAKAADPAPPKQVSVEPAEKTVRVVPVAMQDSRSAGGVPEPAPRSTTRDSFDIPWPTAQRDAIAEQMDWEKLDHIIGEYKQLYERWLKQRHNYQEFANRLTQIATDLQHMQARADAVEHTMNKIRGIIGDQNADNADVFAPPETPRYVQSLAKTYTLRSGEMGRLNAKATQAVNNFNATLKQLDTNIANQQKTLSRRVELRNEWVRITRPFGLWTRQEFLIPVETSTRWILDSDVFAPAYLARCIAEIRQKNYEKALEDIGSATKRDPYWVELYGLQAVLQDRAGKRVDLDQSLKTIRQLSKKKKSAFADVCEGIISARHHNFDGARTKFGLATKDDPAEPAGEAELALSLITHPKTERRDPVAAVEAATAACKATSWNQWWCLDVLAISYAALGDFDRAVGCTHRAKEAAPNDVQQLLDERIVGYKNKQVPTGVVGDL